MVNVLAQPDEYGDETSVKSEQSFAAEDGQDDDGDSEEAPRTGSSLNSYSILPPIKSTTNEAKAQQQYFIKQMQNKYQPDKEGRSMASR